MVGTMISGTQSDIWGRKKTIMSTHLVAILGLSFLRFSSSVSMFYIGSLLGGYTEGVYFVVSPLYTSEINQPQIRNFTLSFNMLAFFFTFSITYVVGSVLSWRNTISILMPLPCICFLSLFMCPESPTWHMLKGRKAVALMILTKLRGDKEVAKMEITRIEDNLNEQKLCQGLLNQTSSMRDQLRIITKGTFIRPCTVLILLFAVGWQWTGEASLTFYTVDIVQRLNIPISAYWISAGIGCYQFLVALLGVFISAIVTRRVYYIGSGICVIFGALTLGCSVHLQKYEFFVELQETNPELKWLPLLALFVYFGGYTLGYVTVPFMLLGELLPSNARSIGSCIVVQFSNISFFLVTKFTPVCVEMLGIDRLFWMFSAIATSSVVFAYFCVPETFGASLEEIEEHYRRVCYPNRFKIADKSNRLVEYKKEHFI